MVINLFCFLKEKKRKRKKKQAEKETGNNDSLILSSCKNMLVVYCVVL